MTDVLSDQDRVARLDTEHDFDKRGQLLLEDARACMDETKDNPHLATRRLRKMHPNRKLPNGDIQAGCGRREAVRLVSEVMRERGLENW